MLEFLQAANNYLYTYLMIALLLGCGIYFTIRTKGVQFRLFKDSCRLLFRGDDDSPKGEKHISSFQAFAVSLASRVGTGNLAGVATAITIGGPGAVFWMWITALLGAATAFMEATMAQLYKRKDKDSFIGGPAYYIESGLGLRWMAVTSAVMIILTFAFGFTLVQCNTIGSAFEHQFGWNHVIVGAVISAAFAIIIFGGIQRIAKVASVIVPFMAIGYLLMAFIILIMNITSIPEAFRTILESAFGIRQASGGVIGAAIMQGVRRGLFSNEAGIGSAPNAAATAHVSHPVKQGLVQALGVFIDTIVICSCTAFILLVSGVSLDGSQGIGIELTQNAMTNQIGSFGSVFLTIALFFFAFSTVIGNYYYGEANLRFFTKSKAAMTVFRLLVAAMAMIGACISLESAWELSDILMGFSGIFNLIALLILCPKVLKVLDDYVRQRNSGSKNPVYPDWWEEHKSGKK
ncbi:MAG: alanine:cation symporter family protein [Bacteroidales bacterium]|nr:alanine:cation symporter family protein [Bacteroidales bacterium]